LSVGRDPGADLGAARRQGKPISPPSVRRVHSGSSFRGLRKEQAQAVYRICQAQEPGMAREASGPRARGIAGAIGRDPVDVRSGPGDRDARTAMRSGALREAKQLLDAKLITDAEYEAIKAKIVS